MKNEVKPELLHLRNVFIKEFGLGCYGTLCNRRKRGSEKLSSHALGIAWDAKCSDIEKGDKVFDLLVNKNKELGIKKVVWNGMQWFRGVVKKYEGVNPHKNHLHIEIKKSTKDLTKDKIIEIIKQ